MANYTFTNFGTSTIAGGASGIGTNLLAADTSLYVATGDGTKFGSPSANAPGYLLLGTVTATHELVSYTGVSGDRLTGLTRALEGTSASIWATTTSVQGVVTAGMLKATSNIYNVKAYGVAGDGVTDDTVSILNAMNAANAAGGGSVYLPAGTYLVSGNHGLAAGGNTSLVIPAAGNITIYGDGAGVTTIKHAGGNVNVMASGTSAAVPNVTVRDLAIDGNGCTGYGLIIQYADRCKFANLIVYGRNALTTCIAVYDGTIGRNTLINCQVDGGGSSCSQGFEMGYGEIGTQMIGCIATNCLNGIQFDPGTNGLSSSNSHQWCKLIACEAYSCASAGFNLSDMQNSSLIECVAENNTHFGVAAQVVNLTAATSQVRIQGGTFRGNGSGAGNAGVWLEGNRSALYGASVSNNNNAGVLIQNASGANVETCHFWDDGTGLQATSISIASANTWGGLAVGNHFGNTTAIGGSGTNSATQLANSGLNYVAQTSQTVGASPYTYTNNSGRPQMVIINGGTVSAVTFKRGAGANLGVFSATNNTIMLGPGDLITITYSVVPTVITIDM